MEVQSKTLLLTDIHILARRFMGPYLKVKKINIIIDIKINFFLQQNNLRSKQVGV